MITCFIFFISFFVVCGWALVTNTPKKNIIELCNTFSITQRAIVVFCGIASVMVVSYLINQNRFIYYWDYSGYWCWSIDRMNYMITNSFSDTLCSLVESINKDEYNIFIPTILAFPLKVFGYTFPVYVTLNYVLFVIPASIIQALTATKLIKKPEFKKSTIFVIVFFLSLCFPSNYYAVMKGYADVVFLIPMSIMIYLFVDYNFKKVSVKCDIAIAVMMILTWICRRYTIYFIIGYVVMLLVKAIVAFVEEKNKKTFINIVINFALIGGISLGVIFLFFKDFFLAALLNNYGAAYSAYDAPVAQKVASIVSSFGYIAALIAIVSGILCFVHKSNRVNYISLLLMTLSEIVIFWQIQDMGVQHRMILNIPLFMMCILLLDFVPRKFKKENISCAYSVGSICIALLWVGNFTFTFLTTNSIGLNDSLFASKYYPLQRNDIKQVNRLVKEMNYLTEESGNYIYVAASGTTLNADVIYKSEMPESVNPVANMLPSSDVDLRDGFPTGFLKSKYIVTTDPVELHLQSGQEVVSYLASGVMDQNSYIGCHFSLVYETGLDNGITAKIYEKTSEFTENDLQTMRNYFGELYPGYETLFANRVTLS